MRDVKPDGEMTQRFSKLGQPKGQLLERFCDHHELLDYTFRFVRG